MAERDQEITKRAEARLGAVLRGKYRLDRVLGVGGMGVVYKATHRNLAEFAVKMLHPILSLDDDIRSRFLREGYAANSVKHPGAVLVVDDDIAEDGSAFLVMELLDGVGCEEHRGRSGGKLSVHVASAIVIQLLDVLAAAHAKETVHRDIKPANLFLTRTGTVKVLDFGIARAKEALTASPHVTGTGVTLGTPAFMAPEQARGRTREVDARTDIWAAGATFFCLATGEIVHVADNAHELMITAATQPPRSLASLARDIPAPIVGVIDRALSFRKEDRWQSATEMRAALFEATRAAFGPAIPETVVASALQGGEGVTSSSPALSPTVAAPSNPTPHDPSGPKAIVAATPAMTTATPSIRDGVRPSASPQPRPAVPMGLVLAAMIGAGSVVAWQFLRAKESAREGGSTAVITRDARDAAPVVPEVVTLVAVAVVDAGVVAALPPPPTTSAVQPPPRPAQRPVPPAAPKTPAPPKANCNPPYTTDAQGAHVFKQECL
jgi:serine/threonine-protein kinase